MALTPDNEWRVHRITAMSRPNWSDEERQEKIKQYGSRDDPDYRRNVLGAHGDATNPAVRPPPPDALRGTPTCPPRTTRTTTSTST